MKTSKVVRSLMFCFFILLFSGKMTLAGGDHQRSKQAVRLYVNKQYAQALPLFAQLVANHPENYKYNYYYGVCLLIADHDKAKAVQHLETALKHPKCPEEVYYYLSKAYHMNYMFDEGLRAIVEFNKIIKPKNRYKFKTSEVAESIYSAKRTLDSTRNSTIIENTESTPSDCFSKYAFEGNYGKVLSMPEDYKNKKDDTENPTIFLSATGNVMFYSAYNSQSNSRDIYKVVKAEDGSWGKPECMDATVNTNKDEVYPTCSADGHVLYFSTMGHGTTGGFDIYKTIYSRVEHKWTQPENMGSPYNSPYDDFNYVPSATDKVAYFTSTRNCDIGKVTVCKHEYNSGEQLPIELKGKFACINSPELKTAQITVTSAENDSVITVLNTDSVSGYYNLMLPGAGTYNFKVEAPGYQQHTESATFSEFGDKYFIQEIYLSRDQIGTEDVAISNLTEAEHALLQQHLYAQEDETGAYGVSVADMTRSTVTPANPAPVNANITETASEKMLATMTGVEFRVQIGAFKNKNKEEVGKRLARKTKNNNMMTNMSDDKWHRFYIGHENSYEKAKELKGVLLAAGFKDAFIVAFKDDQPMSASALRTMKK